MSGTKRKLIGGAALVWLGACQISESESTQAQPSETEPSVSASGSKSPPSAAQRRAAAALSLQDAPLNCEQAERTLRLLVQAGRGAIQYRDGSEIMLDAATWTALPAQAKNRIVRLVGASGGCGSGRGDVVVIIRAIKTGQILHREAVPRQMPKALP